MLQNITHVWHVLCEPWRSWVQILLLPPIAWVTLAELLPSFPTALPLLLLLLQTQEDLSFGLRQSALTF